ncbi:MAG: hypothetical protein Fur0025_28870 [Oscillatoriaceae cyanobacterium]
MAIRPYTPVPPSPGPPVPQSPRPPVPPSPTPPTQPVAKLSLPPHNSRNSSEKYYLVRSEQAPAPPVPQPKKENSFFPGWAES